MLHPGGDKDKKESPSGSGSGDKTATNTDKTHSTDSRSESDLSEGTGQQRSSKPRKKLENNLAWGDLEKETWKAAAALRSHVGSLWRNHLSARAAKMRAAHCGIADREGTAFDSYYSGKEVVDYLLEESGSKDRPKEVEFAQNLLSEGFICHIYFCGVFRDAADFVVFIRTPELVVIARRLRDVMKMKEKSINNKKYQRCFSGDAATEWIAEVIYEKITEEEKATHTALLTLREMIKEGLIHHPCRNVGMRPHEYYQIRELTTFEVSDYLVELTRRVNAEIVDSGLLKDRKKALKTFKAAFEVTEFVQWLTAHSNCGNNKAAEEIALRMLQAGFVEHVRGDFPTFKEAPYPWYRFNPNRIATISSVSTNAFTTFVKEATKVNNKRGAETPHYAQMPPPRKAVTKS